MEAAPGFRYERSVSRQEGRTASSLPALDRVREPGKGRRPKPWIGLRPGACARFLVCVRTERPGVLPGIRRDIGEDGHLVDVGIIFGVDVFQFRMERGISGAGHAGISFVDLGVVISFMEVGVGSHPRGAHEGKLRWVFRWPGVKDLSFWTKRRKGSV